LNKLKLGSLRAVLSPPLLFIIYVTPFHEVPLPRGISLSYIDDFALTKGSTSYSHNIIHLQAARVKLQAVGTKLYTSFSVPKTEFIHWRTPFDRSATCNIPHTLYETSFHPCTQVKWLGIWFSSNLSPFYHFQQRYTKAHNILGRLKSLSRPGTGLIAINARRLAQAVILTSLLYGSTVLQPNNTALRHLSSFWIRALRLITNCFRTTNSLTLYPETSLLPIPIYCYKYRLQYIHRVSKA
jgi:hypothetical protein